VALPGVATLALALVGAVALGDPGRGPDDPLHGMLSVIIEWSALVASAAIWAWQPEARGRRRFLRLVAALWGSTAAYHGCLST
jgi:hypothetical protein